MPLYWDKIISKINHSMLMIFTSCDIFDIEYFDGGAAEGISLFLRPCPRWGSEIFCMIIKVSFLAVATIAAYAVSHRNSTSTTTIKPPENDDSNFQQQQIEGQMEENLTNSYISDEEEEAAEIIRRKQLNSVTEIELLHNLVKELQQRKVRLERKLLALCGLKEEQSYIAHLQRHLEDKSAEIEMLNVTITSLQAERKNLQEDVKQCVLAKKQLEMAKQMIAEMHKKMDFNESNMKGRLLIVDQQVSNFPRDDASVRDAIVAKKLKVVENVEFEVLKMKRRNKELELKKRELAVKLVSAQARIAVLSNTTESDTIAKVEEEISRLKHTNEDLIRQVERLQKNRFDMVQQLVYQRWLYTCLRFEIQANKSPSRETLKHEHDQKIKPLTSNPSYDSTSSQTSSTTSSDEIETTTIDSSSSSQTSTSKKSSFIRSIKRWGRSKDNSHADSFANRSSGGNSSNKRGLVRRFSTSMVPVNPSILRNKGGNEVSSPSGIKKEQDSTKPSKTPPSLPRGRRVSFSDSVKSTTFQYSMPKSVKGVLQLDDMDQMGAETESTFGCSSTMNSTQNHTNEAESPNIDSNNSQLDNGLTEINAAGTVGLKSSMPLPCVLPQEQNKVDISVNVGLVAALFFLLFILVACLRCSATLH